MLSLHRHLEQPNDGTLVGANGNNGEGPRRKQFVQLYTSKSYESRRSELLNPPAESEKPGNIRNNSVELDKHVLSPRLVDAIAQTTQVVWANSQNQEGLLGRSDMPLQTAVGMPVAMDDEGNICVVVMFSSHNVQSTDDAMEYLQSISQSATSSNIPCLLPVLDPNSSMRGLQKLTHDIHAHHNIHPSSNVLGEGVTARFVSLDEQHGDDDRKPEVHKVHELAMAPKDTFGIPMLPSFAELGNATCDDDIDIFDEFSYGIWTTIMESPEDPNTGSNPFLFDLQRDLMSGNETPLIEGAPPIVLSDPAMQVVLSEKARMSEERKTRLEEFCSAFLDMSVFDIADVWVPAGNEYPDCLRQVTSVQSSVQNNSLLEDFEQASINTLVKFWTGAVGRAYSSGNPVWSASPEIFVDPGRADAFRQSKILTVLAVPVFSGRQVLPACVVSCYSLVRSGSVPFVLKFVQQALRLLWDGLDKVQPHQSVGRNWRDVAPADLGEMAADMEMQHHFITKKRPRARMSESVAPHDMGTAQLAAHMQTIQLPSGETVTIPFTFPEMETTALVNIMNEITKDQLHASPREPFKVTDSPPQRRPRRNSVQVDVAEVQQHVLEAMRSVANARHFEDHKATTSDGSKRAHIVPVAAPLPQGHPLPMPCSFPTTVIGSTSPRFQRGQTLQPMVTSSTATARSGSILVQNVNFFLAPKATPPVQPTLFQQEFHHQVQQHQQSQVPVVSGYHKQTYTSAPIASIHSVSLPSSAMPSSPTTSFSNELCVLPHTESFNCMDLDSNVCRIQGCSDPVVSRRPYCPQHSGNRLCEHKGCTKCAQGSTRFCIAHGGGRRCTVPGCDKGARDKFFCAAHGGGKRCKNQGCTKSAVGGSTMCTAHGGGRRCSVDGCDKSAQSSTSFCVKHGGGKKCAQDGCEKVARGRTPYCAAHGGGIRCKLEGCNRVAIGKFQLCRAHGGGSTRAKSSPPPSEF